MDDYSDDGFQDLDPAALQELENNAVLFTQAQAQSQAPRVTQPAGDFADFDFEDDDLDDTEVVNGLLEPVAGAGNVAAPHQSIPRQVAAPTPTIGTNAFATRPQQPSASAYRPYDSSARPVYPGVGQARPESAAHSRLPPSQAASFRPQFARPAVPVAVRQGFQQSQANIQSIPDAAGNDIVAALQQRVRALESELNSAKGEAAIIRSKSTRAEQDHMAEIARLKKRTAEQEAKHQRAVEAAVSAKENATTELQFLQRDMKEASTRTRQRDPAPNAVAASASGNGATTPKKAHKSWNMADGFDDMDIVASPSKGRGKGRDVTGPLGERTPTKNKRKRPAVESPVMSLETHETIPMTVENDESPIATSLGASRVPPPSALPFEFLQLVLDHGTVRGEPPTFDILSRYSFPSDPSTSFAAIIFQKLPLLGSPHNPIQLLVDFCRLLLNMWEQCHDEQYWRPLWDLTSLLAFTLQLQTASVAPHLINQLIPVAQKSIYKVAECRFKSVDGDISADPMADALQQQIDTTYILSILNLTAASSMTSTTHTDEGPQTRQAEFWRMVPVDLVLIFLMPNQKLDDILAMLDLLCTSALRDSVGPLVAGEEPDGVASMVIEKVTANLVVWPKAASAPADKHAIGLAVLRTLTAFSQSPFGALQVASHATAIPRLVTILSRLVDEMYDMSDPVICTGNKSVAETFGRRDHDIIVGRPDTTREDTSGLNRLIKQIVLLLHFLVTNPRTTNVANIQSKLAVAYGGSQRYILALSRIHFAEEDLVYEAGIDEETADLARELCEFVVTPDEGEGVRDAFGA